jgi:formylglycine-generating enzyme required for sulfatase activity
VRFPQFISIILLAVMCAFAPAYAEKRVALVIGNESYVNLAANEQLQKAVNDARAVGMALKQIGFDVIEGENLGRQALLARIDQASQRLTAGDTVFFFFSGHGIAVDGFNYILPTDVPAVGSGQFTSLTGAAIREEDVTAAFQRAGARVAIVVLDACRNNPFAASGTKGVGGEKGLAPHEPPSGVFTFYAASRGESALDRLYEGDRNPNSVFTRVLVPALSRPNLDLPALAREVREEVTRLARTVNHAQRPAYYDETSGDRIFLAAVSPGTGRPGDGGPSPSLAAAPAAPATPPQVATVAPPVVPAVPAADLCGGPVTASFPSRCAAPLTAAQERGLQPKDVFRECDKCPEMVVIPAGTFSMGAPRDEEGASFDEVPQHRVVLGQAFAAGRFAVTFDEWDACVGAGECNGYRPDDKSWGRGQRPVINVSWSDAKVYTAWLSGKTGKTYRLLSEAEREYATRAGTTTPFWWGSSISAEQANYNGGPKRYGQTGEFRQGTLPVDSFRPNPWGLYQVHGNVFEWTEDCEHTYLGASSDGAAWAPAGCRRRIVRGGSWYALENELRAAFRYPRSGNDRSNDLSFRVGRNLLITSVPEQARQ